MHPTWIWPHKLPQRASDSTAYLVRFRTEFVATDPVPATFPLSISADSRFRLFINNNLVATGPLKPTDSVWFIDTVDLGPSLRPGVNVVGVEVLSYPDPSSGNVSIRRTSTPGLCVSGAVEGVVDFSNERTWRCSPAAGRAFLQGANTVFLGIQEHVEGTLEARDWLSVGFDDSGWMTPIVVQRDDHDPAIAPIPRSIPPMTLAPLDFTGISRRRGDDPGWSGLLRQRSVTIGPHQRVQVDLSLAALTTAFVSVQVSGGARASIELTAAECYEGEPIDLPWVRVKGDRTDSVNGDLHGDPDVYRVGGWGEPDQPETYSPFWFRTIRYLRVAVQTDDDALTIHRLSLTETHYPLAVTGSFNSSSPLDSRLWETSLRTLRNCMHETFEDCPFYEQLQYAMDTRSQALFSLHLSTDDRLVRRAITDFAVSGQPNGLTESRAPSNQPQIIPGFSLFWVFMVAEHLDHVGDREFTRQFLARVHAVLAVFDESLTDDGFVISPPESPGCDGEPEVWNFVDWTAAWRATRGVPDLGPRRANTIITFQYAAALRSAARIATACGEQGLAAEYRGRARDVLRRLCGSSAWDPDTRYFRDSDTGTPSSQHAQVWAVLAGAVTGSAATDLLSRAVRDLGLAACSYAMSHSLFDALRLAGLHQLVDWTPWKDMLDLNLSTWAEDTVSNRSDCHAWGSVPLQHFPRWVLGVSPASPGFEAVRIDPAPSNLAFAEGTVPTIRGPIHVRWDQRSPGVLSVAARGPAAVAFVLSDKSTDLTRSVEGHEQVITFRHPVGTPPSNTGCVGLAPAHVSV